MRLTLLEIILACLSWCWPCSAAIFASSAARRTRRLMARAHERDAHRQRFSHISASAFFAHLAGKRAGGVLRVKQDGNHILATRAEKRAFTVGSTVRRPDFGCGTDQAPDGYLRVCWRCSPTRRPRPGNSGRGAATAACPAGESG